MLAVVVPTRTVNDSTEHHPITQETDMSWYPITAEQRFLLLSMGYPCAGQPSCLIDDQHEPRRERWRS